jgi:hypothetical protein
MITTQTIEQRVTQLEAELERINSLLPAHPPAQPAQLWWDTVFGVFADCPAFDEVEGGAKPGVTTHPTTSNNDRTTLKLHLRNYI